MRLNLRIKRVFPLFSLGYLRNVSDAKLSYFNNSQTCGRDTGDLLWTIQILAAFLILLFFQVFFSSLCYELFYRNLWNPHVCCKFSSALVSQKAMRCLYQKKKEMITSHWVQRLRNANYTGFFFFFLF